MTFTDAEIKQKIKKGYLVIAILLVPPWSLFLLGLYYYFIDNQSPLTIIYEHPKFLSKPANNKSEALANEIDEIHSGEIAYSYRELCLSRPLFGTIEGTWLSGAFVWSSPQRTFPNTVGCTNRSYAIVVPTTNPTRNFVYTASWTYIVNSLVTTTTKGINIPLVVLSSSIPHPEEPHIPYNGPAKKPL